MSGSFFFLKDGGNPSFKQRLVLILYIGQVKPLKHGLVNIEVDKVGAAVITLGTPMLVTL